MKAYADTKPVALANRAAANELFCGACGYGIVVRDEPPDCPMCRAGTWRLRPSLGRWN